MIENIKHNDLTLAILIYADYNSDGIQFFTPESFSQQLGYMSRPTGYVIQPHTHTPVLREIEYTNEVLFIKAGAVRIDFYSDEQSYLESRILRTGDVILLAYGGHGFEMLQPTEIIEVKQGPFVGELDKIRFSPVPPKSIIINNTRGNE